MVVVHGVRVAGPLAAYAEGLAGELGRLGFTPLPARQQLQVAAHLSRWLAGAGLGAEALTGPVADRFLAERRAAGYTAYLTPKALGPLLGYLRRLGVAPQPGRPEPAAGAEALLEAYRAWLLGERGVQPAVARGYLDLVRPFAERHAADGGAGLCSLTAARHLVSVIEGLRWPVLFGVYSEQQAMDILDAQLDLIFGSAR